MVEIDGSHYDTQVEQMVHWKMPDMAYFMVALIQRVSMSDS
jgi:hypothetical protein